MKAHMMLRRQTETDRCSASGVGDRRILAIGKRIDHRWLVEMAARGVERSQAVARHATS